jgi:hypothetical protein
MELPRDVTHRIVRKLDIDSRRQLGVFSKLNTPAAVIEELERVHRNDASRRVSAQGLTYMRRQFPGMDLVGVHFWGPWVRHMGNYHKRYIMYCQGTESGALLYTLLSTQPNQAIQIVQASSASAHQRRFRCPCFWC